MSEKLRLPAEESYAAELKALAAGDSGSRPPGWALSPRVVVTYLMGGKAGDGTVITPKYVGDKRLIETAIATLATDRALLLLGVPGTAKSWVSEHLAAGITGDSTLVIQCTAGTDENQIRYGWNYAQLLAHGPRREALVPTPLMRAMEGGKLCRFEELTRMGSDVQDTLITVLSEKMMPVPELNTAVYAQRGFNIIATANNRDKGVNELSSALKRRFNVVVLPLPDNAAQEVEIIVKRLHQPPRRSRPVVSDAEQEYLARHDLRSGRSTRRNSPRTRAASSARSRDIRRARRYPAPGPSRQRRACWRPASPASACHR